MTTVTKRRIGVADGRRWSLLTRGKTSVVLNGQVDGFWRKAMLNFLEKFHAAASDYHGHIKTRIKSCYDLRSIDFSARLFH